MPTTAWYDRTGGLKFTFTGAALSMGFLLALAGKLTGEFTAIIICLSGFFNTANTLVTVGTAKYAAAPGPLGDAGASGQ